jgi:hypothetical protein
MDLDDITKDLERISMPGRPRDRRPDLRARHGQLKAMTLRALAFLLLAVVGAFGLLVIYHYHSTIMLLIAFVYFGLGAFLAYKLFSLTYVGWLYTLLLSAAGILMPVLALVSRGFSNPTLATGAVAVIIISLGSAALLWWAKDLFGIKSYREIFMPYT